MNGYSVLIDTNKALALLNGDEQIAMKGINCFSVNF